MDKKQNLGKFGEDLACEYLVNKGYKIIERNFRKPWGEIDIISKSPDKVLVFVEVKAMKKLDKFGNSAIAELSTDDSAGLKPEDHLTSTKLEKIKRTASLYVGNNPNLINNRKGWQIDLLAIDLTNDNECCDIRHYENI